MLQARCFQASIHVYMKPEKSLRTRAMEILSRREISRAELKRKLAPYADGEEEIEKVLAEFAERQWQSDARYAEAYVHSKSRQHGALRLKQALLAKGVADELIQPLLPAPDAERQAAIAVLRKKFKQPAADLAVKQKQMRFLAYRGFDMEIIHAAIKSDWAEAPEE